MEEKKSEKVIFKKTHEKSRIVLENLALMRDPEDKSLLGKDRSDIVILQVMPLERHGALVEYVAAEDYEKNPLTAVFDIINMASASEFSGRSETQLAAEDY